MFCAIVTGQADAEIVLRSKQFVAFLDTRPLFHGHVLVVPVVHVETFDQLPSELGGELVTIGQRMVRAVESAMEADGSLMIVNNIVSQSVPHLHLHVIPRTKQDGLRLWLGPRHRYRTTDELATTGARIRAALEGGGEVHADDLDTSAQDRNSQ